LVLLAFDETINTHCECFFVFFDLRVLRFVCVWCQMSDTNAPINTWHTVEKERDYTKFKDFERQNLEMLHEITKHKVSQSDSDNLRFIIESMKEWRDSKNAKSIKN